MLSSKANVEMVFLILIIAIGTISVFWILYLTVFKLHRLAMCKDSQIQEIIKIVSITREFKERGISGFEEETFEIKTCVEEMNPGDEDGNPVLKVLYEDAKDYEVYPTSVTWEMYGIQKPGVYNVKISQDTVEFIT